MKKRMLSTLLALLPGTAGAVEGTYEILVEPEDIPPHWSGHSDHQCG